VLPDLVVHPDGGGFVYGDDHAFAQESTVHKMLHDVSSYVFQPIVPGDQIIILGELSFQLLLLVLIQLGIFYDSVDILIETRINKLERSCSVFIV